MAHPTDLDFDDRLLASAVRFLVDGGEEDAASVLLSCALELDLHQQMEYFEPEYDLVPVDRYKLEITFRCPRAAYDVLADKAHAIGWSVRRAFKAVAPSNVEIWNFEVRGESAEIDPNWRNELLEIARGKGVHNQLAEGQRANVRTWKNLRFRSQSEVRVAIALDEAGVFFLPNCKGRLTTPSGRENREADFLICYEGKWGILEVDGEPFHPPSRTVQDHERDRLFKSHGVRVVEHFDASECFENAAGVVKRFLDILKRS